MKTYNWEGVNPDGYFLDKLEPYHQLYRLSRNWSKYRQQLYQYHEKYQPHQKYFFFQAEDGIRDKLVTGVQTCALPIVPGSPAKTIRRAMLRHHRQPGAFHREPLGAAVQPL